MNRVEKLNEELKRRGAEFTVREHEKWVNGVYYKGLMLWSRQNNINPIIYDAEILTDFDPEHEPERRRLGQQQDLELTLPPRKIVMIEMTPQGL